jgi:2-phospho-L-lactate transferase/gluconeogenesis factor (CofD/UPF0052 family)
MQHFAPCAASTNTAIDPPQLARGACRTSATIQQPPAASTQTRLAHVRHCRQREAFAEPRFYPTADRLFYINLYGQEIFPEPNGDFFDALDKRDVLVYSCGSLWTSIIPCLALRGLATSIAQSKSLKAKVMLCESLQDTSNTQ